MIRLQRRVLGSPADALTQLQTAIGVEFGVLPPYLYALYSIRPGTNQPAVQRIHAVVLQEMVHMCLACNILNALGGDPQLTPQAYPGPLPGDIGPHGASLTLHLLPFSKRAMQQAMDIEEPEEVPNFPIVHADRRKTAAPVAMTIGEFYEALDAYLATLPDQAWTAGRNQIDDKKLFDGQVFAVNGYADAHRAITEIVSEGEGSKNNPLDVLNELSHFYRFQEIHRDLVLSKSGAHPGFQWGPSTVGVDWNAVYPAISDPGLHDFTAEPQTAQDAQADCNSAYVDLVKALQAAMTGSASTALDEAVQAMFKLKAAALHAFTVPLADARTVSGPAFLYKP